MTTASPRIVDPASDRLRGVRPAPAQARVPDLRQQPRAGLSRFRRQRAKAGLGHRPGRRFLPHRLRQRASRRLSPQRALDRAFEAARDQGARFLNAADAREIVFVRGATEAINLVAQSWGAAFLEAGDESPRSASSSITRISCRGRCCATGWASAWWWRRSTRPAGSISPRSRRCCRRAPGWSR